MFPVDIPSSIYYLLGVLGYICAFTIHTEDVTNLEASDAFLEVVAFVLLFHVGLLHLL